MSDEAERIRRQMQDVRQDMGQDVHGIVQGAKQLSDWHYYVRQHPWACVGGAFAVGFLLTPARKQLMRADVSKVVEHLRSTGVLPAAASGAPHAGGLMGTVLAMAGPYLLKGAATLLASKLAGGSHAETPAPNNPGDIPYPAP